MTGLIWRIYGACLIAITQAGPNWYAPANADRLKKKHVPLTVVGMKSAEIGEVYHHQHQRVHTSPEAANQPEEGAVHLRNAFSSGRADASGLG